MKRFDGITDSMNMDLGELRELVLDEEAWRVGRGGLACWNSWGRKESDMTERMN